MVMVYGLFGFKFRFTFKDTKETNLFRIDKVVFVPGDKLIPAFSMKQDFRPKIELEAESPNLETGVDMDCEWQVAHRPRASTCPHTHPGQYSLLILNLFWRRFCQFAVVYHPLNLTHI